MFIVRKNEASNKTIRMPDTLIDQLEELAASENISFNQLVVQCCTYALNHLPADSEKISCTQDFLKKKRSLKAGFIQYMEKNSRATPQSLAQMFTDAIFLTQPYHASLGMDFYNLLSGAVETDAYRQALQKYFSETGKKAPVALARDYTNAFKQLKAYLEAENYI